MLRPLELLQLVKVRARALELALDLKLELKLEPELGRVLVQEQGHRRYHS